MIGYRDDEFLEQEIAGPDELGALQAAWPKIWVNVDGLGDEATLRALARRFRIHRLVLEDVVNSGQRPKVEHYEGGLFVVAHMPAPEGGVETEQLSLFVGEGFLLSFQERAGDWFEPVRERIRHGRGLVRTSGVDYLAYALLDGIVDAYFPVVEALRDELEALEEEVLRDPRRDVVEHVHDIKRRLAGLRRTIGPHREAINTLLRDGSELVQAETAVHLRDCYDHLLRLTERVEIYREQCSDLMATYLSLVSNRMNEVMKVLTIMASIFIPLTFLAGVYGMNFDPDAGPFSMPELRWRWGYPAFWMLIVAMAAGMTIFFRRRRWW